MSYKPGDAYCKEFTTSNPSTGAVQNADSLPVATANRNGTDDGSFSLTVTNIDTGRYKIAGTIPSGYAAGDVLGVSVAATVNSVAGKAVVDTQVLDGYRLADLAAGAGAAAGVNLYGSRLLAAPRALDAIADGSITVNDALWCAVAAAAGKESVVGTAYTVQTPFTGTAIRTFSLDSGTAPTRRS